MKAKVPYHPGICLERPKKKTRRPQSGQLFSGPKFEPRTSRILTTSANHWAATFGPKRDTSSPPVHGLVQLH